MGREEFEAQIEAARDDADPLFRIRRYAVRRVPGTQFTGLAKRGARQWFGQGRCHLDPSRSRRLAKSRRRSLSADPGGARALNRRSPECPPIGSLWTKSQSAPRAGSQLRPHGQQARPRDLPDSCPHRRRREHPLGDHRRPDQTDVPSRPCRDHLWTRAPSRIPHCTGGASLPASTAICTSAPRLVPSSGIAPGPGVGQLYCPLIFRPFGTWRGKKTLSTGILI